jgi:hypothetical protein
MGRTITAALVAACAAAFFAVSPTWALDKAGVSAAVHGDVTRINQGDPVGMAVASGDPIYRFDRITSGSDSGLQILLLDETTLTIGPNSNITITEFVYDPSTGIGKLAASIGNGVFRFVSGRIAQRDPSSMTVQLPVASLGIRGTIVFGRSDERGAVVALGGPGLDNNTGDKPAGVDVVTPSGTAELRRPGWAAIVNAGQLPVVQRLPPSLSAELFNAIRPPAGGTRGAGTPAAAPTGRSASRAAGQSGAGALTSVGEANKVQNTGAGLDQAAVLALQQTNAPVKSTPLQPTAPPAPIAPPVPTNPIVPPAPLGLDTTFDQLRSLTSGVGRFVQDNIPLSGSGGGGHYDFSLTVDFAARSASGKFNLLFVSGAFARLVSSRTLTIGGQYAGSTGPALFSTISPCGAATCDATAQLQNTGSTIAAQAAHSLTVSTSTQSASGTGVAPRH